MTEIDGLDIHFIHVKSRHDDALPLIITHGWPGSVIELLGVVGSLTDPTAHGGRPSGGLTRDHILDNVTLSWVTNTATSAARLYWEGGRSTAAAAGHPPPEVSLPVAFTVFPGEIFQAPRSWVEQVYPNFIYFHQPTRAATSPPGRSRNCFPKKSARASGRSAR